MIEHLKADHGLDWRDQMTFSCRLCGCIFPSVPDVTEHAKKHTERVDVDTATSSRERESSQGGRKVTAGLEGSKKRTFKSRMYRDSSEEESSGSRRKYKSKRHGKTSSRNRCSARSSSSSSYGGED